MASADYISREYVLKCMEDSYKNAGISAEAKAKMTRWLKNAPAADVRPVVYCRECKYWELSKVAPSFSVCTYVCGATFVREAEDFCSRGEKREEN